MKSFTIFLYFILMGPFALPYPMYPYRCGFHTKKERGLIATPNFPKPYPVPIICQWVIEAPANHKIAVYFTQFYMKTGFSAAEYAHYNSDINAGVNKADFGIISSRDEPTYLVSNQRILVLKLLVYSLDNIHLRVTEHLLETYGFNITYEVLQKSESVRKEGCIYHHCSFTGFCIASETLEKYSCECVSGYFGEECQYDDDCGPTATSSVCYNGGTCRYYIGSSVRTCECPAGFEGAKCENRSKSKNVTHEANSKCEGMHYSSHPDYIAIYPDDKKCPPKGKDLYIITAALYVTMSEASISETIGLSDLRDVFENSVLAQLSPIFAEDINVTAFLRDGNLTEIYLLAESTNLEKRNDIKKRLKHLQSDPFIMEMNNLDLRVQPILFIERMEISEKMPVMEGMPLLIACIVRGGPGTKVQWLKDHYPIVFSKSHGRLWNSTVPNDSQDAFSFLLGFDNTHVLDSGIFTCTVDDEAGSDSLSVSIIIKQLPKPLLTPLSATLRAKDPLKLMCVSQEVRPDMNVAYIWTRNERPLLRRSAEQVEDLFPSGSRVILKEVVESANYTCAIQSIFGIKKETSVIKVVSDEDFVTCPRETLYNVNWKLTAAEGEDIHICPSNYTGYIGRKCVKAKNQSAVWQEPDFSRCISNEFLQIKNEFESFNLGYKTNTLSILLKRLIAVLTEKLSTLHLSESEPLVDILTDMDTRHYMEYKAEENWKILLNTTSMLLNSTSVYRKKSKWKMFSLLRSVCNSYSKQQWTENSSTEFVSPTLIVKMWKIREDYQTLQLIPGELHSAWNSSELQLGLNVLNSSDFEGNSSITVSLFIYKSYSLTGLENFPSSDIVLPSMEDFTPIIITEAKDGISDYNIPIKMLLTFKHIVRSKLKLENLSCYKVLMTERNQSIQACDEVERSNEDITCHCFGTGLLSVTLLQKQATMVAESSLSIKFKVLPVFGAVISITFLIYTISMLGCKARFSSLFV